MNWRGVLPPDNSLGLRPEIVRRQELDRPGSVRVGGGAIDSGAIGGFGARARVHTAAAVAGHVGRYWLSAASAKCKCNGYKE